MHIPVGGDEKSRSIRFYGCTFKSSLEIDWLKDVSRPTVWHHCRININMIS